MSRLSEKRKAALESMMKETIYEAAVATLLEHGLEGLTMERVAEAAEMAKGTLYNYFTDKRHLILYVFMKVARAHHRELSNICRSKTSPAERLVKVVEQLFHGFEQNRQILVVLAQGRLENLKEYSTELAQVPEFADAEFVRTPIEKVIESIIDEGVRLKHFYPIAPSLATGIILGALTSIIDKQVRENHVRVDEESVKQFLQFIKNGLIVRSCSNNARRSDK